MRPLVSIISAALLAAMPMLDAATVSQPASGVPTTTPIQHLVVIFQENVSFDHYFATYPVAANLAGEPVFKALPSTPTVNGLSSALLTQNPNLNPANGSGATNPFRLDRTQAATADQDHDYTPEQMAFDKGLMDLFPMSVGTPGPPPAAPPAAVTTTGLTMGYYDGNTLTALWNYAQRFAMSDNSYGTNFGPSTVGAINLVSGQTNGAIQDINPGGGTVEGGNGTVTVIGDPDPVGDVCSTTTGETVQMSSKNIGDLLNASNVSWGFFEGGFNLGVVNPNGTTGCSRSTTSLVTATNKKDYIPHHQPFQYYASTANLAHVRPTSVQMVGKQGDAANHQYDIDDFFTAASAGNLPAVSFLKAIGVQDGHAGYSDPLDEAVFLTKVVNFLQTLPTWSSTAVVIAYDDSDGWYDHQMGPIVNQSTTSADALTGPGACGTGTLALPGPAVTNAQGRCGYGPRLPFMVISPYAKTNFVDHTVTDQTSIIRFVEDNWLGGQRIGTGSFDALAGTIQNMFNFGQAPNTTPYLLDGTTGTVISK